MNEDKKNSVDIFLKNELRKRLKIDSIKKDVEFKIYKFSNGKFQSYEQLNDEIENRFSLLYKIIIEEIFQDWKTNPKFQKYLKTISLELQDAIAYNLYAHWGNEIILLEENLQSYYTLLIRKIINDFDPGWLTFKPMLHQLNELPATDKSSKKQILNGMVLFFPENIDKTKLENMFETQKKFSQFIKKYSEIAISAEEFSKALSDARDVIECKLNDPLKDAWYKKRKRK